MIVRIWKGQTTPSNAAGYLRHVTSRVFAQLGGIGGYRGGWALRRDTGQVVEFLVVTHWDSWEAIRSFAGDEPDRAVVEPAAQRLLTEFDSFVRHFEVAHDGYTPLDRDVGTPTAEGSSSAKT
jgi:heme-degrading monooxygenase HmoA